MELIPALLLFVTLLASAHAFHEGLPLPTHLLPEQSVSGRGCHDVSCLNWRFGIETNNIRSWTVPSCCEDYVGHYMLGDGYRNDCKVASYEAALYARSLNLTRDGNEVWVFDIDETVLSNLPFYAKYGLLAKPIDYMAYIAWMDLGNAPALPESLKLYKKLLYFGYRVVFLTGRPESKREITVKNLKRAGYHTWESLILRGDGDMLTPTVIFKSAQRKKLEEEGYIILGNMGDQWSDILGTNIGKRTFKVPNPMYYVP